MHNCHRMSSKLYAITIDSKIEHTTARGGLKGDHFILVQLFSPIRRETAVGRAGHRVLIDTYPRGEKTRDEIIARRGRTAGDDYSSGFCLYQQSYVGLHHANGLF